MDENGGGYAILQAEKDLPNPNTTETIVDGSGNDVYKFQFNDDIGFNIGDYWIVNIHSKSGVFSGSNPSFGNQTLSGLTTSFLTYQWPQQSLTPRYAITIPYHKEISLILINLQVMNTLLQLSQIILLHKIGL